MERAKLERVKLVAKRTVVLKGTQYFTEGKTYELIGKDINGRYSVSSDVWHKQVAMSKEKIRKEFHVNI